MDTDASRLLRQVVPDGADTPGAAAGITVSVWRNPVEPAHRRFSNGEMAAMNVRATIAVAAHVTLGHIDWDGIAATLTDPDRPVMPDRTARDAFGDDWLAAALAIADAVDEHRHLDGPDGVTFMYAWALMICPAWYGAPGYRDRVDAFTARHPGGVAGLAADDLRRRLLDDPGNLPAHAWDDIVVGGGLGWVGEHD